MRLSLHLEITRSVTAKYSLAKHTANRLQQADRTKHGNQRLPRLMFLIESVLAAELSRQSRGIRTFPARQFP